MILGIAPARWGRPILLLAAAVLAAAAAIASERLLEGADVPPGTTASVAPAPRSYADLGDVGIVLVSGRGRLVAYVDRRSDNGPVVGGKVSAEVGDRSVTFEERARGVYVADAVPLKPGTNRVALSIASDRASGLVEMTLAIPAAWPAAAAADAGGYRVVTWIVLVLLAGLAAGGLIAIRSLRRLG